MTLRVAAWLPYPTGLVPSQRFRIEQWQQVLALEGISLVAEPFIDARLMAVLHQPGRNVSKAAGVARAIGGRLGDLCRVRRYDGVVIHRAAAIAGPALAEAAVRALGVPMVFDFDDAIWRLHTSSSNRAFGWLKYPGKTATLCRLSDHVVAGNEYLAEYARQHNDRVTVVPTSIDTDAYVPRPKRDLAGPPVLGWTGSSTSQTHLEMFGPMLRDVTATGRVRLLVISDRRPDLPGVPHEWKRWDPAREVEDLSEIDIGIMPMPDDEWSRGKCALKALQCMALGQATVCSDVGANRDVIRHGENGLLARTLEEWRTAVDLLARDPQLRARLGGEARATVEQRFSKHESARRFANVLRSVMAPRARG